VLIECGDTRVLCTASFEEGVPDWKKSMGGGWLTAEYDMLPSSTTERRPRTRTRIDGRTQEIQRLIGRSLRAVLDLNALGENSILIDCDVLQADGGTRTVAITGAYIALLDALRAIRKQRGLTGDPLRDSVAAVSVGLLDGKPVLDLCYAEDVEAEVDLNVVMTGSGQFIEVQGTGEHATFSRSQLDRLLTLATAGIRRLTTIQRKAASRRQRT
jgi:ribonuclease PH